MQRADKILENHSVEIDLESGLPLLDLDMVLMEQVLFNLFDNAAKYAPQGSRITVTARHEHDSVILRVLDEGEGIPEADLERIFDKFFRVRRSDRQRAGTGLGLAICRGFRRSHGRLDCSRQSDRPDRRGVHHQTSRARHVEAPGRGHIMTPRAGPLRILVVDDEPAILRFLHASLESQGYIVATAADAHTALDMVRRHTADLVVLDLGLPDMDGLDVVRQIRDGGENLPIIILSSRENESAKVKAFDLGADDYVTKPFGIDGSSHASARRSGIACSRRARGLCSMLAISASISCAESSLCGEANASELRDIYKNGITVRELTIQTADPGRIRKYHSHRRLVCS